MELFCSKEVPAAPKNALKVVPLGTPPAQFVLRLQFWAPVEFRFHILFVAEAVSGMRRAIPRRTDRVTQMAEKSVVGSFIALKELLSRGLVS